MPHQTQPTRHDPLGAYRAGAVVTGTAHPVPLAATRIEATIAGAVALVTTERVFRNVESSSIEATITFPIPVHATLTELQAEIDGRVLGGRCQRRRAARQTYEAAIDAGRSAVLHEEVLKGVHMISVGHIPPGAEIKVTSRWISTLAAHRRDAVLRIPTTVGEIYGRSPLPDSDDLTTGAHRHEAEVTIVASGGTARLRGHDPSSGPVRIRLDAPIEILVTDLVLQPIEGEAADGSRVILSVVPAPAGDADLDLELLLDESGSMDEACEGSDPSRSKWQALCDGVAALGAGLGSADRVTLRAFASRPRRLGDTTGPQLASLVRRIDRQPGGTEIGLALDAATAPGGRRDVLLVTDGKSHAIDVQALARRGRRISCVLVGEDSLDAHVGHLAALTGGDLRVATGGDVAEAIAGAVATLRCAAVPGPTSSAWPRTVTAQRGGMLIEAAWREAPAASPAPSLPARAIGAFAAALCLAQLDEEEATLLAEREGIVCHLTSLVLVDEAGAVQDSLPAQRKVDLTLPRTVMSASFAEEPTIAGTFRQCSTGPEPTPPTRVPAAQSAALAAQTAVPSGLGDASSDTARPWHRRIRDWLGSRHDRHDRSGALSLATIARRIDWSSDPDSLCRGDLSALEPTIAQAIRMAAETQEVIILAEALGMEATIVVLALLALTLGSAARGAQRLARRILDPADPVAVVGAGRALGL